MPPGTTTFTLVGRFAEAIRPGFFPFRVDTSAPPRTAPEATVGPVVAHSSGRRDACGESLFRDVLERERRRAERFDAPFAVLLLCTRPHPGSLDAERWARAIEAVRAATRASDVLGWAEREKVLGIVLPDVDVDSVPARAGAIESRVRRELDEWLGAEAASSLTVRLVSASSLADVQEEVPAAADPLLRTLCVREVRGTLRDAVKRSLDISGSLALLCAFGPLMLLIGALVKLTSSGPVFFRQVRIGAGAKPFTMLKFRTMYTGVAAAPHQQFVTAFIKSGDRPLSTEPGQVFKLTDDPRITRIGRILRKTSLDELPQFWNVLRGNMSLVGPRPPLPYEIEQYQRWHLRRVLDAKPGITGLWQVSGRSRTTFDGMVRLDIRYARTRCLWTDIKILLATPSAVITGKGAC